MIFFQSSLICRFEFHYEKNRAGCTFYYEVLRNESIGTNVLRILENLFRGCFEAVSKYLCETSVTQLKYLRQSCYTALITSQKFQTKEPTNPNSSTLSSKQIAESFAQTNLANREISGINSSEHYSFQQKHGRRAVNFLNYIHCYHHFRYFYVFT